MRRPRGLRRARPLGAGLNPQPGVVGIALGPAAVVELAPARVQRRIAAQAFDQIGVGDEVPAQASHVGVTAGHGLQGHVARVAVVHHPQPLAAGTAVGSLQGGVVKGLLWQAARPARGPLDHVDVGQPQRRKAAQQVLKQRLRGAVVDAVGRADRRDAQPHPARADGGGDGLHHLAHQAHAVLDAAAPGIVALVAAIFRNWSSR